MNYSESEFKEMVKQTLNELDDCKAKWSMKKDKKREQSVIISATAESKSKCNITTNI